jgi:mannose-6-phosphate isomerase
MDVLVFNPIYQERVWGGRGLATSLGRELPAEEVIGESWEIVDRPEANSVVAHGANRGRTLEELRREATGALMGPRWDPAKPFPILVKWLDCQERLSLQVHPPAEVAPRLAGEPKTENWYIVEAGEGAAVLAGLRAGVTRAQFEAALTGGGGLEALVHRLPTRPGDSLFVPSGRLHAIDAGNLILEIQQNSDTTYRVYDWGRVGLDGNPRQLHVEASMESIDFGDFEPDLQRPEGDEAVLVESDVFRLRSPRLRGGGRAPHPQRHRGKPAHRQRPPLRPGRQPCRALCDGFPCLDLCSHRRAGDGPLRLSAPPARAARQ